MVWREEVGCEGRRLEQLLGDKTGHQRMIMGISGQSEAHCLIMVGGYPERSWNFALHFVSLGTTERTGMYVPYDLG